MELNYNAIKTSPLYEKCRNMVEMTGKKKSRYMYLYIFGFFGFMVFLMAFAFVSVALIPLSFIVVVIGLVKIVQLIKRGKSEWVQIQKSLTEFATQNSFQYQEAPYMQYVGKNLPETTITLPYRCKLTTNSGYMSGVIHDLHFDYISGSFELVDEQGRTNSQQNNSRPLMVMSVSLPIVLPKLLIDTKRNNIPGFELTVNTIEQSQRYDLEGDFSEFYKVLAEKNTQIDVLSILSPDVMQKLLENRYFDVWIDGDKLVVFSLGSPYEYFGGIDVVFSTTSILLREIDKIARQI